MLLHQRHTDNDGFGNYRADRSSLTNITLFEEGRAERMKSCMCIEYARDDDYIEEDYE